MHKSGFIVACISTVVLLFTLNVPLRMVLIAKAISNTLGFWLITQILQGTFQKLFRSAHGILLETSLRSTKGS